MITLEKYLELAKCYQKDRSLLANHLSTVIPALKKHLIDRKELLVLFKDVNDLDVCSDLGKDILKIEEALLIYENS